MAKMVTNTSLFAKRGDPMITDRDRRKMFGPPSLSDDPDMDQWTKAGFAKREQRRNIAGVIVTKAKPVAPRCNDSRRTAVAKVMKLRRLIKKPRNEEVSEDRAIARVEALRVERKS